MDKLHLFREDNFDIGRLSATANNFAGHFVRISEGVLRQYLHGSYRPYGEATIDDREYWLVPKDLEIHGDNSSDSYQGA